MMDLLGPREKEDRLLGESVKFGLVLRIPLILFGVASLAAAGPMAFVALVAMGGGHGNPFGSAGLLEWLTRLAILAVPALLVMLGVTSIRCVDRFGLRQVAKAFARLLAASLMVYALL